ncbi:MAG TPA: hypothetical protein VK437_03295 [Steroidobacteraceae bacterium]|nr:hypothetical protein [Steroidobacteraceae bacterium]
MTQQNVLPAALILLANSGAILSAPVSAAAATADTGAMSAMPIAATFTATNEAREPARLQAWVGELVKNSIAPSLDTDPPLGRCGTISGSGNGWDDSRQDC